MIKSKMGYKLVVSIVLFSSVITLIATGLQIFMDYRVEIDRVNNYETMIRKSYLKSIVTSVWVYDDQQIQTQLNGILQLPDMEHLEILSDTGAGWGVGHRASKNNLNYEFPLLYSYKGEDVKIGTLHAVVSLDNIYARLIKKAITILISNAVKTFLVSGFILLIFQYLLTRHLYSLSRWMRHLDIGKSFEKFQLNRKPDKSGQNDELDELVLSINQMQDNLKNYFGDLIKSEKKYKILIENIPIKVFHKDIESVYVACNINYAVDLNIQPDQIAGKTDFDFFSKELAKKYLSDDKRIIKSEKIESFEDQYIYPGGNKIIVQSIKAPVRDEDNKVIGLIGALIDLTELEKAKTDLKKSEERFIRLMEGLQKTHFFFSQDTQGNFTYLSPSIKDVLGYSEENFLTHYTRYLTDNTINKEAIRLSEMAVKGLKQLPYEIELFHNNGTIRQLQVTEAPVFDTHGKVVSIEGMAHDVTEIKKIETQLRQAQKMEAIGTLAGGIAHDFNNILSLVLGYAEMILDDAPKGSIIKKNTENILTAGHRAKDMVKQILAFSRQSDLECIPFQPAVIVKEAFKMIRHSIPTTIDIQEDIDPNCDLIMASPAQVHQIVMNLSTNAFHAMEQTGGCIFISLKNRKIDVKDVIRNETGLLQGQFIELIIKDTGPGIDPAIQDKIFNPYFTTKEIGKGTGMGLAIVHGIVQSYGGAITIESNKSEGAAFHVFFPATKSKITAEDTNEPVQKGSERILLVDDEEELLNMTADMLKRLGYKVTARQSSIEALKIFKNKPDRFDLIITDQTMPVMTGANLAQQMMQIRPDIRVILCTGYSSILSKTQAMEMGIKQFVLKPVTQKEIAGLIRKVLDAS
ncbi:PAS domain S-box protein [Desulfobacula phenolica]|uniref:histidine kinase n=1 Tax=Desulfobacula phenolica TaxID=90732 RepID=A0A1H2JFR7_9BACT|nr:PAS domain S-box protein [Desulfobacula phenolica]SDU55272.1 PAS domain S-box-containing protein [Desulfobacula phenolica]